MEYNYLPELDISNRSDLNFKQEKKVVAFDEKAENKKIVALQKLINEEKAKSRPDRLQMARWQARIVSIRQSIFDNINGR